MKTQPCREKAEAHQAVWSVNALSVQNGRKREPHQPNKGKASGRRKAVRRRKHTAKKVCRRTGRKGPERRRGHAEKKTACRREGTTHRN